MSGHQLSMKPIDTLIRDTDTHLIGSHVNMDLFTVFYPTKQTHTQILVYSVQMLLCHLRSSEHSYNVSSNFHQVYAYNQGR